MDMRFYWVCDQVEQKHFQFKRNPWHMDLGDYLTKQNSTKHHRSMRQTYLVKYIIAVQERILWGCSKTRNFGIG